MLIFDAHTDNGRALEEKTKEEERTHSSPYSKTFLWKKCTVNIARKTFSPRPVPPKGEQY